MAFFEHDGASIHYEVIGEGFPVLLIAPGGMYSEYDKWDKVQWNPLTQLDGLQLIAMDQRNAGQSTGPISGDDGWHTYTGDQLALMDHLGFERFAMVGMCIGGAYIANMIKVVPQRVAAAVILQTVGRDNNQRDYFDIFDTWQAGLKADHPEVDAAAWASFRENMYGGDFLFSTTRDEVANFPTPIMLLMGNDLYHPESISRDLAALLPNCTFVEEWKEGDALNDANQAMQAFLAAAG